MSHAGPSNSGRSSVEPRPRSSSSTSSQTTQRLSSSLSSRPHSSLSTRNPPSRPSSSASQRPPSSTSYRPPSSVSYRTTSGSTRPQSRYSHRPSSRHARSRLIPQCQILVSQVTGLKEEGSLTDVDGENFRSAVDFAVKNLEASTLNKAAASVDLTNTDRQISGHALKARINSRDELGEAMERSYAQVKALLEKDNDLDQEIKLPRLPDHLQFLFTLSTAPSRETLAYASDYLECLRNPPQPPPELTWKDILAEEPFEGEHWQGVYGLPPGSVRGAQDEDINGWDSTPSLSPLNSDDLALDDDDTVSSAGDFREPSPTNENIAPGTIDVERAPAHTYAHRKELESLQSNQYWRKDWHTDANPNPKFNLGDPSTLGPAIITSSVSDRTKLVAHALLQNEKYINEEDAVREVLMALQGRKNTMLQWANGKYTTTPSTPKLIHLSQAAQLSVLSSFARLATVIQRLRQFVTSVFSQPRTQQTLAPGRKPVTRTCEAFADALDHEVRAFDSWCAAREEDICRASAGLDNHPLIVSLLSTEMNSRKTFEASFQVCLDIANKVFQIPEDASQMVYDGTRRRQPSVVTTLLLDTLFSSVQEHLERSDIVTSNTLTRVFVRTAEPLWGMVGKWLRDGMGAGLGASNDELDDEFFIESNTGLMGMGLLHPDFWQEGYSLREADISRGDDDSVSTRKVTPAFLQHVSHPILSTGKAVGLIRALGLPSKIPDLYTWRSFSELVKSEQKGTTSQGLQDTTLFSISVDRLSKLIYDGLLPHCRRVGEVLSNVLVTECELWRHLQAVEGIFFMRQGDTMSHFIDILFSKMDTRQSWGDFHFLNTAFQDVVEANAGMKWLQASLVRLSYRSAGMRDKDKSINRTVKAIEGLIVEYSVPFPLTYILRPISMQIYNEVFLFFLQIRRAKSILERILARGKVQRDNRTHDELKSFYALRSRLSWFTNTLLNFLATYVVQSQVDKFHEELKTAASVDEMIQLHDEHLDKIQGRCLLKPNTAALHRAILSVLDICLHFSEAFVAFAGDTTTTHDVSRQSVVLKRHRSRRRRRQRRNVIAFSQQFLGSESSSEDEADDDVDISGADTTEGASFSFATSSMISQEDGYTRIDKMSSELDGLVRFIRRGVESLAGGTGDAAPAFGVLAFSLEDWDL